MQTVAADFMADAANAKPAVTGSKQPGSWPLQGQIAAPLSIV